MNKSEKKMLWILIAFFALQSLLVLAFIMKEYWATVDVDIVSVFVIVEIVQSMIIIIQFAGTNRLLKNFLEDEEMAGTILANALNGWLAQMFETKKDGKTFTDDAKVRQGNFFAFIQVVGKNILAGATGTEPGESRPVKTGNKLLDGILNLPGMGQAISKGLGNALEKTGAAGADIAKDAASEWAKT